MVERPVLIETKDIKIKRVSEWVRSIGEKKTVGEISRDDLREVLSVYGANFQNVESNERAIESLRGYSEKERALGVKIIWGEKMIKNYQEWIDKTYIPDYESRVGNLPELKPSGRKNSGMRQFLYELTSFTSNQISEDEYRNYTETRVKNGLAWEEKRKNDRIRIKTLTSNEPILLASFPPEFVSKAWQWIQNQRI